MVTARGPRRERSRGAPITTSTPEFDSVTIDIQRVSRMVAGGRRFRFRALIAVGNKKGIVGIGVGKGLDVRKAVEKATRRAHADRQTVYLKHGTIPREIEVKEGTSRILMRPARPGHGIVAGGVIRTICELTGITDISAKILSRSTNDLANARALVAGFQKLSDSAAIAVVRRSGLKKTS